MGSVIIRRHPGLNGIHPFKASPRSVDSGRVSVMNVVLLVLTKAPPSKLVVKFPVEKIQLSADVSDVQQLYLANAGSAARTAINQGFTDQACRCITNRHILAWC